MKYSVVTFGCRVNQADSLRMEEQLRAGGALGAGSSEADVVVVNTCSVTASADQGARQTIRRIARDHPTTQIVVTGCYATRCGSEVAALPNVLRVVRNDEKERLVEELIEVEKLRLTPDATGIVSPTRETTADRTGDGACGSTIEPGVAGRTSYTLRVQTGCEQPCAYCIIPATRGAGRSVPADRVLREIERAAAAGFREITLTGVHLGSYGRDLEPRSSLIELLRALLASSVEVVFRISSLEPMDCTAELVELVVGSGGRLAPHFHLPLQHGSDRMLALMRRPYTLGYFRDLVTAIASRLPHASIGSDMIVGFPGESADDFRANLEYLPSSPLTHLHVFPYSDRPGTAAAAMRHKVDGVVVRDRGKQLREIGAELARRFRTSQTGTLRPGLTLEDGTLVLTDNYLKVRIPPGLARNQRVLVRIEAAGGAATLV